MPAPTVTREYSLTYGSFSMGSTSDYQINGPVRLDESPDKATVEFEIFYRAGTVSDFNTLDAAARVALLKPRQAFIWVINGTTFRSYSHTGYTGMDAEPRITKDEDPKNTGLSRVLRVVITFSLPFAGAAVGGEDDTARKGATYEVDYDESNIKSVTVSGIYTAAAAVGSARAVYSAKVAALASAFLSSIGGTYNFFHEKIEQNDQNTEVSFVREYRQIIASEAGSADDASIRRQTMIVTREKIRPGDGSIGTQRLVTVTIDYSASIDQTVTTDLKSKWDNTILPWLLNTVVGAYQTGAIAMESEAPSFHPDDNRITARVVCLVIASTDILESRITVKDVRRPGKKLARKHGGDPMEARAYGGPGFLQRTITIYKEQLKAGQANAQGGGANQAQVQNARIFSPSEGPDPFGMNSMAFIVDEEESDWEPSEIGVGDKKFQTEKITTVEVRLYFKGTTASQSGSNGVFLTVDSHPEISGRRPGA